MWHDSQWKWQNVEQHMPLGFILIDGMHADIAVMERGVLR